MLRLEPRQIRRQAQATDVLANTNESLYTKRCPLRSKGRTTPETRVARDLRSGPARQVGKAQERRTSGDTIGWLESVRTVNSAG